jgi:ATP-binding cassette, subfamily C (CFTR/MRP), member 1
MSDSGSRPPRKDQEWENNEPLIKALTNEEPIASGPPTPTDNIPEKADDSSTEKEVEVAETQEVLPVARLPSRRSATTRSTEASSVEPRKKSWNPLKRNPPPVPKERGVSHEYTSGPVSKLFFQWVTPILAVRFP